MDDASSSGETDHFLDAYSSDETDHFLDASNDFPFFDFPTSSDSPSTSQSTPSPLCSPNSNVSNGGLRRRRSRRDRKSSTFDIYSRNSDSRIDELTPETFPGEKNDTSTVTTAEKTENSQTPPPALNDGKPEIIEDDNENEIYRVTSEEKTETSGRPPIGERENDGEGQLSSSGDQKESDSVKPAVGERENDEEGELSSLGNVAELLIKAIGFQLNLFISLVTFPFWAIYYSCMFAVNPFFIIGLAKSYLIGKFMRLSKFVGDALCPFMSDWLTERKSWLKLVLRCGWGLFWSLYVCSVLVVLLIGAFVIGGLMMRFVEEPFQLQQGLNFDYTKSKPVAFVPLTVCPSVGFGDKNDVVNGVGFSRVIPRNQKLQATVIMVLPESDYNRNLGVFQVRVEFLSEDGRSLASFSHPCILEFKSQPLRLLLTFLNIVPLVTGYHSESQTLKLKFRGYKEGVIPTACLKITMEQRAEFWPAAGIPEVYDAFVRLESELPFFKRILWYWRRTIFVWVSMMVFTVELLFALVCCRSVIFPRARPQHNINRRNRPLTSHPLQR